MSLLLGIFGQFVLAVVHLMVIGIDVLLFFIVMKFFSVRWAHAPFAYFDSVGSPLIDPLFTSTQRYCNVSYRNSFLVLTVAISICRFVLVAIASATHSF